MSHPIPKSGIMDIKPYIGGEGRLEGAVRLASNENPLGASPKAEAAYLQAGAELHRYPDGSAAALRAALGRVHDMDPARIVCGAGSDELISLIIRAYAGQGDEVVYSQYGFLMYPLGAKAVGAVPVAAAEIGLRTDVSAVLKAVTDKTRIVLIANPNNPTGSYLTKAEMRTLCAGLPPRVVLVVDSAYAEFVREADYEDGRALVDKFPNVVMLRTFSKIYGLAALRLGWGYFPAGIADVINRVRGPFNLSAPAQAAGIAALEDTDFLKRSVEMTDAGRVFLTKNLQALGVEVHPGVGNFLLCRFGSKAEDIRLALKDNKVFVRQMGAYNLPQCLRITIGTAEDNAKLIATLQTVL
jgi:histidinol-phosphate aminotransferase